MTTHSHVRLTPRGRWALMVLLALFAVSCLTLGQAVLGQGSANAGDATGADAARTWVVQPGDTLWTIAESLNPDTDPRETVSRIVAMNDLPDSAVLVGQELYVPA